MNSTFDREQGDSKKDDLFLNPPAYEQAPGEIGKNHLASAKQKNSESEAIAVGPIRRLRTSKLRKTKTKSGFSKIGGKITVFNKGKGKDF